MLKRRLDFKIVLIFFALYGVFAMESNQSKDFFGSMEGKIDGFSDLINFEPSSISTNC